MHDDIQDKESKHRRKTNNDLGTLLSSSETFHMIWKGEIIFREEGGQ